MSDINCPYDNKFCKHKEDRLDRWAKAIEFHAENKINQVFYDSDESFAGCALTGSERQNCDRYQVWLTKQAKQNKR